MHQSFYVRVVVLYVLGTVRQKISIQAAGRPRRLKTHFGWSPKLKNIDLFLVHFPSNFSSSVLYKPVFFGRFAAGNAKNTFIFSHLCFTILERKFQSQKQLRVCNSELSEHVNVFKGKVKAKSAPPSPNGQPQKRRRLDIDEEKNMWAYWFRILPLLQTCPESNSLRTFRTQ